MFVKLENVFGQLNEAFNYTGEKEFHKAFAKATGFKTHAGGYFGPAIGSAHIKINLYDCLNYKKHLLRPGVYGDLEIKRVTPMNEYHQAKLDIVYQGVEMECGIGCFYPPRVAKAKNKQVIDLILKQAGVKADYDIVIKNYQPEIELSEENFNKIAKIRVGDKIGDFLVYDAGMADTKSVEQYYIIMTSYKEQFAMHVSKNPAINESTSLNESVKIFNDAAKLIAGYLNIKFKPTGTPDVFEVSGRDRMKIEKLQEGDILDNNMMVDGIVDDNYTVNIELRKPGMSRAIIVRFTDEPEMFESEMSESSNSELLKLAKSAAKTLGIKFKETPNSYKALMGASFEITEKDFIKIVNAFKRAQSDPAELGFYDMTFDNHEMDVLIDFEDYDDSILFYVGGINESEISEHPQSKTDAEMNESTVELNEVTGLPKHKTSVPSHML